LPAGFPCLTCDRDLSFACPLPLLRFRIFFFVLFCAFSLVLSDLTWIHFSLTVSTVHFPFSVGDFLHLHFAVTFKT
jgi:hypothetical protein